MRWHSNALAVAGSGLALFLDPAASGAPSAPGGAVVAGRGPESVRRRGSAAVVQAATSPGRLGDGPLKVVHRRPRLLPELPPVVNDQIDDLLVIQAASQFQNSRAPSRIPTGSGPSCRALPQPGVLEPQVRSHPAIKHLLRDVRVGIDHERRVGEAFGPLLCRFFLRLRVGNRGVVEVLCEIGEVVAPVVERVEHDILRVGADP